MKNIVPLEGVLAPLAFIAAGIGAGGAWSHHTDLPIWLSAILGVVTGWLAVMGAILIVATLTNKKR